MIVPEKALGRVRRLAGSSWRALAPHVLCFLLGLAGCTVKRPQVPILDLTVSISVADDTTTIRDVAKRTEFLRIDPDDRLALDFTKEFDGGSEVGESLQVTPGQGTFRTRLGPISVPGQEIPVTEISLRRLLGAEVPESESTVQLGEAEFEAEVGFTFEGGVTSLAVEEGGLALSVRNNLPVQAFFRVALSDVDRGGVVLGEIDLGGIASGNSAAAVFDLAGKRMSGSLALRIAVAADDAEVRIQGEPALEVSGLLHGLTVSEATGLIPQQVLAGTHFLEIADDRIQAARAEIREGVVALQLGNGTPVPLSVTLTLDDLHASSGEIRTFTVDELLPGGERKVLFDLAGNELVPLDPLSLRLSYEVRTLETDTEVTLRSDDELQVEAFPGTFLLSRMEGTLDRVELPMEAVTDTIDFPNGLSHVALSSTSLSVFATSAAAYSSELNLSITGTNRWGESSTLLDSEILPPGNPDDPVSMVIERASEDLVSFMSLLPTEITVVPEVFLGDGASAGVIEADDWVRLDSLVFDVPARFRITADTRIEPEPVHREFSDDEWRRRIRSNLKSASVTTKIESHIPLGLTVSVQVGRTAEQVYRNPVLTIPADGTGFGVAAALVDEDRRVVETTRSEKVVELTAGDVLVFLEEGGVYTGVLVQIEATDGEIELFGSDFFTVQAGAQIFIEMNESLVE